MKKKEKTEIKVKYHLTTNLTIFPVDLIDWAKKYGITFLCDIDGPENLHNKLRPSLNKSENSFFNSAKTIEKLTKAGLKVALRATITSLNVESMCEIAKTHKALGGENSAFVPLNPVNSDEIILDSKLYPSPLKYGKGLKEVFHSNIWDDPENIYPFNEIKRQITSFSKNIYGCGAPYGNTPVVTVEGDIYPCIYWVGIKRLKVGNVYDGYNNKGFEILNRLLNLCNVNEVEKYKNCQYRFICGGGCPVRRVTVYDNPDAPVNTIKYAHTISCVHSRVPIEELLWHNAEKVII